MVKYRDYKEELIDDLKDHDEAVAYLNAAWEESLKGDEESQQLFLLALRNVAEAQGGLGNSPEGCVFGGNNCIVSFREEATQV